jgi:hypothetical protein
MIVAMLSVVHLEEEFNVRIAMIVNIWNVIVAGCDVGK